MKVLMQNRYDALTNKGGDSYQMIYTKNYLEENGIRVAISTELEPDLKDYDIVHLFNITRVHETYVQFRNAVKHKKKIVVSSIYHSMADIRNYETKNLKGLYGWLVRNIDSVDTIQLMKTLYYVHKYPKIWYSWFIQMCKGYTRQQKEILENIDCIIPNTELEIKTIKKELFGNKDIQLKYEVVYNGIESKNYKESAKIMDWLKKNKINDYILCSGRIEPRKNQLKIIEALRDEKIQVIFAGGINKMHRLYADEFIKQVERNDNLFYTGRVEQDEMMTLNRYAKVSVLASWLETTGLAGLEGGIMGCNVVITDKGYTREYYHDHAWYCDPEDLSSVRNAVMSAYSAPRDSKRLGEHINKMKLTWKNAAEGTLKVYKKLV